MNFYKKYFLYLAVLWYLCLGCSSMPWQKQTLVSYQSMGAMLNTAKPALISRCENGMLSPEECEEARAVYNKAVTLYKFMGDAAIQAIDSENNTIYNSVAQQLMELLTIVNSFIEKEPT